MGKRTFAGRTVVITGAGGGLGAAYARRFARAGARLALLDIDEDAAGAIAREVARHGVESVAMRCDVTDEALCRAAVADVAARFGGIDVLINNAGITHRSAFAHTDVAVFRRVMDVNLFGAVHCTQAALPHLLASRGLVIVISSVAGFAPLFGRTGYAASKHACQGMFSSLRAELAGSGVDVMIVCPGFTATGIGAAALDGDGRRTQRPQSTVGHQDDPDRVADVVLAAAERSRKLLVLSAVGKTTQLLMRVAPSLYERMMTRSLRHELG